MEGKGSGRFFIKKLRKKFLTVGACGTAYARPPLRRPARICSLGFVRSNAHALRTKFFAELFYKKATSCLRLTRLRVSLHFAAFPN
jgi:hypothetical protein